VSIVIKFSLTPCLGFDKNIISTEDDLKMIKK
jgi:hypothetical protein